MEIRIDDLSPYEIQMFNVYKRLVPLLTKQGYNNPETIAQVYELYHKHGIDKGRIYYNIKSLGRKEYALIRPVLPEKEILSNPESLFAFVKSSNLQSVTYLQKLKILEIEFLGGSRYRYYKVDKRVYNNILKAPSHGKYFWRRIRRRPYKYRRIA